MDRQGFDPITKTLSEVVNLMERIEQSEDFDGNAKKETDTKTPANK